MQDATSATAVFLDRYVAAWNEPDPARRRMAVRGLYADHARILTPSVEVNGVQAILEHIGEVFVEFVGSTRRHFRCIAWAAHHEGLLLHWELAGDGQPAAGTGWNVLFLGLDGHIETDHQFSEPQDLSPTEAR
jgi:hypothetical protein